MSRKFRVIRYIWVCFFPYDLRFIGSLAIWKFFLSFKHKNHQLPTIDSAILPTAYCGSQSKNPPHIRQKRTELDRVNFRKDFWDYFQRQRKILANSGHPSHFLTNLIGKIGCSSSKYRKIQEFSAKMQALHWKKKNKKYYFQ